MTQAKRGAAGDSTPILNDGGFGKPSSDSAPEIAKQVIARGWRDVLPIHPAAEMFPLLSPGELKALAEDIKKHGLRNRVALMDYCPKRADGTVHLADMREILLEGRSRLDAMESLGWALFDKKGRLKREYGNLVDDTEPDGADLPYAYVLSANVHRRHLTAEQKRELIAKLLKAQPEKSNRQIAKATGTSHPHIAKVREELEQAGDVETVTTSIDTKGRKQPTKKTRRTEDDFRRDAPVDACDDIGPASRGEVERLRARGEELENEKRRLEREFIGLRSKIEEAQAGRNGQRRKWSIDRVHMWLRNTALEAMDDLKQSEWPDLIATLREEVNAIEKIATERVTAEQTKVGTDSAAIGGAP